MNLQQLQIHVVNFVTFNYCGQKHKSIHILILRVEQVLINATLVLKF